MATQSEYYGIPPTEIIDVESRAEIISVGGQTVFPFIYKIGYVDVWRNGVKASNSEISAANGTSVTFINPCIVGEVIQLVSRRQIPVTDIGGQYALAGINNNITSLTGLTTPISIGQGGTGATSAPAALTALGAQPALGYTPYNSSNPAGYITSVTGSLGYTPVQQGTGVGQATNIVKIGWTVGGGLKLTVDVSDLGYFPMSSTAPGTFTYSGAIVASGNVTAFSDARFKTNWRFLSTNFVEQLATVQSGVFDRTDISETQVGVSAQSLQKVIPEAVMTNENGFLSVAYGNAALAACIELAKRVVELEARLAKVEGK